MKPNQYSSWLCAVLLLLFFAKANAQQWNPNYAIGTTTGNYVYSYNQTPDQLVETYPPVIATGATLYYQWEQSNTPNENDFAAISGATSTTYSFSAALAQTTYFRRKVTDANSNTIYSNIFKIQVSSVNWENYNYIREYNVLVPNITDWKVIDQLPIGQKLQTTTYLDGLGRPIEKVSRETATPQSGGIWGDVVQFSQYDPYGRQPQQYLPYTTTTQSGKFKTLPLTDQPAYYASVYNETAAYSNATYDYSPLNRVTNVKAPGTSWSNSAGNSAVYDLNDAGDNVPILSIGYNTGDIPTKLGVYAANTLFKNVHTDENNKQVVEYINKFGQLILKAVQLADDVSNLPPLGGGGAWIGTYSIYDDFGRLRFQIQPEAVKYFVANGWNFSDANAPQVLNEMCFRYQYDDKGRTILKKAPGAKQLNMVYDSRDRVVFMQDGNQSVKNPPEWTTNLYDELDRLTITTLYRTTQSISGLQTAINNAATVNTVTINNTGENIIDLVVDNRKTGDYTAQNTIQFVSDAGGDFTSANGDEFTASIDPAAVTPSVTVNTVTFNNTISSADLNNPSVSTILKYYFYDDYSFAGSKTFDNNYANTTSYSNAEPIASTARTGSFPTGDKVRVLGTNTFLTTTHYYDEKGRSVQSIEDNIKQGSDVTTMQYHWDGRLLSSHTKHSTANSGYTNYSILTQNVFDVIGRLTAIQRKYGDNNSKTIASYDYDDMGRLKTKHLDPDYTNLTTGKSELESLSYSYNIHNNITGINKDYALKAGSYNKWGNYFGLVLGFDDRDHLFNTPNLNGQVTGLLWNTQGDDAQRKYDYTYDNAGRLVNALFNEKQNPGDAWNNAKMDFSSSMAYDLNGNLQNMLQKGVIPGQGVVNIDNLTYAYAGYSNKLMRVTDNGTAGTANGNFGDFKDGTNTGDDYVYDDNGNLVVDLNKNVKDLGNTAGNGISYNFLDKPEQIRIAGKGTIKIVYDADGNKLQRSYTPETTNTTKTTTYINQFVYEDNDLSYINFEEGRIRIMQAVSNGVTDNAGNILDAVAINGNIDMPGGKRGAYDYYIRDYQQNVRMILTEETHSSFATATMESNRKGNEDPLFGQTGGANEVEATRVDKPSGWSSNTSVSVSQLGKLTHTIGPNSLLKVMAGDEISTSAQYYYQAPVTNNNNSLVSDIVSSLIQAISGNAAASHAAEAGTAGISSNLNVSGGPLATIADPHQYTGDNIPRAYLNILFFDERFNFVGENSTLARVSQVGDGASPLVLANIKAPKNGYAYIYVSNESDQPVYFDNFKVGHNRGRIIEENHYYAYGLKIAGISSKKFDAGIEGSLKNNNLYNDKELWDDGDLNWYDYGYRNYDPQIGRFPQLDPLTWEYPYYTPYQYAGNEPIANVDMDGLEPCPVNVAGIAAKTGSSTMGILTNLVNIGKTVLTTLASQQAMNFKDNWSRIGNKVKESVEEGLGNMKTNLKPGSQYLHATGQILYNPEDPFANFIPEEVVAEKLFVTEVTEQVGGDLKATDKLIEEYKEIKKASKWVDKDGKTIWPTNNDGFEGTPTKITLPKNAIFDRYGDPTGTYGSPEGTPYKQRSLAPGSASKPLKKYKVLKPLDVQSGKVAPWFDQPGGGMQYKFDKPIQQLLDEKYIKEIKP